MVRSAVSPTTACVMARTVPPSNCTYCTPLLAKDKAMGRLLETMDSWCAAGVWPMRSATALVVVPASKKMLPVPCGKNSIAARAIAILAVVAERSRESRVSYEVWKDWEATAPDRKSVVKGKGREGGRQRDQR